MSESTNARTNDFEWVSRFLGVPVPLQLRELHDSGEIDTLKNIIVDHVDDETKDDDLYFCIARWTRQNQSEYKLDEQHGQRRLLLTRDPSGNICYALPEEDYKTVYTFGHEKLESESLGIDIPSFIALARYAKSHDE